MTASRLAVFTGPRKPFEVISDETRYHLPEGFVRCRVRLSTICGSDVHTYLGRRKEPTPSILGHEIIGDVLETAGTVLDADGTPLSPGQRITWSIMASCGSCFFCTHGLEQKCTRLMKYGHHVLAKDDPPAGGFADEIFLRPGTAIFPLGEDLPDEIAVVANCAVSTAAHAVRAIKPEPGETILVQGCGLVGLAAIAFLRHEHDAVVVATDPNAGRLGWARHFGAAQTHLAAGENTDEQVAFVRSMTDGRGADAAIEAAGVAAVYPVAIEALRTGGRYLLAGSTLPTGPFPIPAEAFCRRMITISGIHNYRPDDLRHSLRFLARPDITPLFEGVVESVYPLDRIQEAFHAAFSRDALRVAIKP